MHLHGRNLCENTTLCGLSASLYQPSNRTKPLPIAVVRTHSWPVSQYSYKNHLNHHVNQAVALEFSIDGLNMPNQTIYCSINFYVCLFILSAALEIVGFNKPIP